MRILSIALLLLGTVSVHAAEYNSVAYCEPTQAGSVYDHIELFYDDDSAGIFVAELLMPGASTPIRHAVSVEVKDLDNSLTVSVSSEKISIKKGDPKSIFEMDGAIFSCEKADW